MSDWGQAFKWLQEGKYIRRQCAGVENYLKPHQSAHAKGSEFFQIVNKCGVAGVDYWELAATDWVLYEGQDWSPEPEVIGWRKFPKEKPKQPGKKLVLLGCGERTWTSMKCWEKVQVHHSDLNGAYRHEIYPNQWVLGMEFKDTRVVAWMPIPELPEDL